MIQWFETKIGGIVLMIITIIIVLSFLLVVMNNFKVEITQQMNDTYTICCDGLVCSDTIYNYDTGECEYFSGLMLGNIIKND